MEASSSLKAHGHDGQRIYLLVLRIIRIFALELRTYKEVPESRCLSQGERTRE